MKRLIIAIIILALILGFGIAEQHYIHKVYSELEEKVTKLSDEILVFDEYAYEHSLEIYDWWQNKREVLEILTPHNDTKDLVLRLKELSGYIEAQDQKSSLATASIVLEICDLMPKLSGISWQNVF